MRPNVLKQGDVLARLFLAPQKGFVPFPGV